MLSETIKNNSKKTNLRTKATKFSNMFQTEPTTQENKQSIDILFQKSKFHEFIKLGAKPKILPVEEFVEPKNIQEENTEDFEYIVEDPQELVISLPIASTIELPEKLPFFKSITAKLATVYN